jgi:hypothetical protein
MSCEGTAMNVHAEQPNPFISLHNRAKRLKQSSPPIDEVGQILVAILEHLQKMDGRIARLEDAVRQAASSRFR